jgi:hypothetical protein
MHLEDVDAVVEGGEEEEARQKGSSLMASGIVGGNLRDHNDETDSSQATAILVSRRCTLRSRKTAQTRANGVCLDPLLRAVRISSILELTATVRSCQKQQSDESRCKFFLWDTDAHNREAAALSNNSRTETRHAEPATPSRRQPSPPPPYTIETGTSGANRKRSRTIVDLDDDYGLDQADDEFNNELDHVMTQVETPSKVVKTSEFATPATRRKLPWQKDQSAATGLQTPQTGGRASMDPFNTRLTATGVAQSTPTRNDHQDGTPQIATPSSSFETPTPGRFRNVSAEDLARDVFGLLQDSSVRLTSETENELKGLLSRHAKSAEGSRRGRDVLRTTVRAKDAKIAELTYRVNTLEAELEAEKEMKKHLQWELGAQSDT